MTRWAKQPWQVRLLEHIQVVPGEGCWEWDAGRGSHGYGELYTTKMECAHRLIWICTHGPIPDSLHVLHKCDNKKCCRPAHLFLGTHRDNMRDAAQKHLLPYGENHSQSKLTEENVREIRSLYSKGFMDQYEIGEMFGVGQHQISRIVNKKQWARI